jgi:gamma-D-glutamyl-L-lysine dipeptidyl-peptidase
LLCYTYYFRCQKQEFINYMEMKKALQKIIISILILFAGSTVHAQTNKYKALMVEIQSVQKKLVPDKRMAILNVLLKDTLHQPIVVKGETNLPEGKKRIVQLLTDKGIQFVDSIKFLPEASLGSKIWGIAKLSVVNMRTVPAHAAEMASQVLMGTPVKILAEKEEWLQVQTPDGYIGWMNRGAVVLKTEAEMTAWKQCKRYIFNKINGFALASPNKKAQPVSDLVLCDLFEVVSETKGYLQIRLPDGRAAFVKKNDCISFEEWTNRPVDVPSILSVAQQMMGVPYFWGGTSSKATDCSGLTKTSYYSQGVILTRDASQQVRYGSHPDFTDYRNLQPGDLIFFGSSPQRVTHVALCLENGTFIHASGSSAMVRLNSLNPSDSLFDSNLLKILVGSSRIINSLNTDGIVSVKNHPWYSLP